MIKNLLFYVVLSILLYFINKQLDNFFLMVLFDLAIVIPAIHIKKRIDK
ncbi:TPA: hypothetical protein VBA94_001906 [Streptococcus agalactiae]|nr:hypothetical protein [Streptococcus agalactiae]